MRVLPPVGQTAKVAFYSDTCDALAQRHPLLRSLLAVSKPRAGTYRCPASYNHAELRRVETALGERELFSEKNLIQMQGNRSVRAFHEAPCTGTWHSTTPGTFSSCSRLPIILMHRGAAACKK